MAKKSKKKIGKKEAGAVKTKPKKSEFKASIPYNWKQMILPMIVLAVVAAGLYGQTVSFDFVLDDAIVLSENAFVQEGVAGIDDILFNESMTGYFGQQQDLIVGARYRPLSLVTFALEKEQFGLDPKYFHLGNILYYIFCCWAIFLLFTRFYPLKKGLAAFWSVPFVLSFIYVIHPLHTEAVANIKGRDEILTMLFAVLSLLMAVRFADTNKWIFLLLSAVFFFLGLLAKENAITFLAVIPLFIWFYQKADIRKLLTISLPLVGILLAYLYLRNDAVGYLLNLDKEISSLMNNPFVEATAGEKFATIFYTLGLYIKLHFFPHPLTHDYYPYHIPLVSWTDPRAFISLLMYAGLSVFAIRGVFRSNHYAVAILYFIVTISIVSNLFVPIGTFMNERFMFMPSLAFCLALAYFVVVHLPALLKQHRLTKPLGIAILLSFVIGFSWKSYSRIPAWESKKSLNIAAYEVSKNSTRANQFMGYYYYEEATDTPDATAKLALYQKAEVCVDRALEIYPTYIDALRTKAGIRAGYYQLDNDLDKLLADFYRLSQVRRIGYIEEYLKYLNRRADAQKLLDFYHKISMEWWLGNRNDVNLAYTYLKLGEELDPNDYRINRDLAIIGSKVNNNQLILQHGQKALRIRPDDQELQQLVNQAVQSSR